MTDLTPTLNSLLSAQHARSIPAPETRAPSTDPADEFLKEAHRINTHITSLLTYLHSIRHAYLSTTAPSRRNPSTTRATTDKHFPSTTHSQHLTDPERDAIDSSTALLLRDLATSLTNLSSAETLRQETSASLLRKKYGHSAAGALLWRWAGGGSALDQQAEEAKSAEQVEAEERAKTTAGVREGVLWFLRRGLEGVASVQRGMVEKRIERVREREKSVLYKSASASASASAGKGTGKSSGEASGGGPGPAAGSMSSSASSLPTRDATLSEADAAQIEAQLSPEQLQLFAEENDSMLRHYEDTLGKVQCVLPSSIFPLPYSPLPFLTGGFRFVLVLSCLVLSCLVFVGKRLPNTLLRNAEKSLLEISALQETLVSHLATQEEYIFQLVSDVDTTQSNVGRGNKELKRATERRSTAQAVFWGTVGLCTWLVVWDLVF
ncbi:uncharacterized protein N7482_002047 [Penicillium canariense]|uniref:SNARE-complex protein Syntaxin-18 N-terminal domain-containing protein n=1 Tax=Penicillium canariense TaxID=189055 RepID=A0A9W9IHS0_9EURO|nr:uncharacterized protein N7482_002047 [Penicillium canariense]KAJ5176170.1 hypothetical protein N7482_002047 [Penicillium canariense]